MKSKAFAYLVVVILTMAALKVKAQAQEAQFPSVRQYQKLPQQEQVKQLNSLRNHNDQQAEKNTHKVTEVGGTFGERDGVVFDGKEGEYEEERKTIRSQSDGSEIGIANEFSNAGANAATSEGQAAWAIDAFQNNGGDLHTDSRSVNLSRDEKIVLQRLKEQYKSKKLVRDKDFIVNRDGERVIVSEYGYKVSLTQLVSQTEIYNSKRVARERADDETKKSAEVEFANAQTVMLNTLHTLQISAAKNEDREDFEKYSRIGSEGDELRLNYRAILDALNCNRDCGHVEQ